MMSKVRFSLSIAALSAMLVMPGVAIGETITSPKSLEVAMKSRTCGLIFMSGGRADVRAGKMESGMEGLIAAFALLQDGRELEDKNAARVVSQKILSGPKDSKDAEIAMCRNWLGKRMAQPNFSKTQSDKWNWANQAQMAVKIETHE